MENVVPAINIQIMNQTTFAKIAAARSPMKLGQRWKGGFAMGDYIERDKLLDEIEAAKENGGMGAVVAGTLLRYIKRAESIEVRPVVRGRWRWVGQDKWNDCYECSQCGKMNTDNSNFCPNCGADMKGE